MKDLYSLLGINKRAGKSEIKKAYRESAKKCHPDINETEKDPRRFREITEAYETLCDNDKRKEYDNSCLKQNAYETSQGTDPVKPAKTERSHEIHTPYVRDLWYESPAERQKNSVVDCVIHLSLRDAQTDIEYPYTLTLAKPCPYCYGVLTGFVSFCRYCGGSQVILEKKELIINIPGGTPDGTRVKLSLDHVGLKGMSLNVKLAIG